MKISGFTICRNAVKYDFPIVESINSILPIVDEFVVNVGDSEDKTEELIKSIQSPKIRIIHSVWDESLQKDGLILSVQTNIALNECKGDWAFYLQADEVIHENDLPTLMDVMRENLTHPDVLGLYFRYLHFYGDYFTVNPWGYHWAVRIIKNNKELESSGDGVGFSLKRTGEFLWPKRTFTKWTGTYLYHYSRARNPKIMVNKLRYFYSLYYGDAIPENTALSISQENYGYDYYDISKEFRGTHPQVMKGRVKKGARLRPRKNRWFNLRFYKEIFTRGLRGI